MSNKHKVILIVCLIVLALLTFIEYYHGYKYRWYIHYFPVVCLSAVIGIGYVIEAYYERRKNPYPVVSPEMKQSKGYNFPLSMIFTLASFGGWLCLGKLRDERVDRILLTQTCDTTIAKVNHTYLTNRFRDKVRYYAIIEYYVNGQKIEQKINNDETKYHFNRQLVIVYSREYPEMCWVLKKIEGPLDL